MNIKGTIKSIGELQTFDSGFVKQQIILTEDSQYVNHIPIDFLGDKSDLLQHYKEGDEVDISINIRGSEYEGKNYVSISAWRIEKKPL